MPVAKRNQRTGGCHVCSRKKAVGIWRDNKGWLLKACGEFACVTGYEYVRSCEKEEAA